MPITPTPAVLRAGDLLGHLARHPAQTFSVSELARAVGIPRATCDAVLQALAEHGLVARRDDLRYALGVGCIALGDAARIANSTLRCAAVEAEQLGRALAMCTAVSVHNGNEARVAEVFDFGSPVGPRAHVGQSIPLVPPFGAAHIAWSPEDAARWIAHADAGNGHEQRDRYGRALEAVRRRGYSITVAMPRQPELAKALETLAATPDADQARRLRDELIRELMHSEYLPTDLDPNATTRVSQMSAPVFDSTGHAVVAILVTGPEYDLTNAELHAIGEQLVEAANRATNKAGGRRSADV